MRRYEDMPYEQICETLKMSLPAVKSLLFRARTELRRHLASYLGEDVPLSRLFDQAERLFHPWLHHAPLAMRARVIPWGFGCWMTLRP